MVCPVAVRDTDLFSAAVCHKHGRIPVLRSQRRRQSLLNLVVSRRGVGRIGKRVLLYFAVPVEKSTKRAAWLTESTQNRTKNMILSLSALCVCVQFETGIG